MRFNPRARLDPSQVEVRRGGGRGGFGGGGLPIPMGVGGGAGGLVVLIIVLFLSGALGNGGGDAAPGAVDTSTVSGLTQCKDGDDANSNDQCRMVATVNNIQGFWDQELQGYTGAKTVLFQGATQTGCGQGTAEMGPFYCPTDTTVYLDYSFFAQVLQGQLGAQGGDFAEAYVLAHEYGHHVENLLGYFGKVRTQQGRNSDAVKLELMADCLGGMWAKAATTVEDDRGEVFILDLTQDDIRRALDAAAAVGDDAIQERGAGRADPESWTHGSSAAREMWFRTGYEQGTVAACDTWKADSLYPS